MYPDLPIEQLVRRKDTRFQLGFATEAKQLLPPKDEFVLAPSPKGLRVLGCNEDALGMPVEILREVYGPRLCVRARDVPVSPAPQPGGPDRHCR